MRSTSAHAPKTQAHRTYYIRYIQYSTCRSSHRDVRVDVSQNVYCVCVCIVVHTRRRRVYAFKYAKLNPFTRCANKWSRRQSRSRRQRNRIDFVGFGSALPLLWQMCRAPCVSTCREQSFFRERLQSGLASGGWCEGECFFIVLFLCLQKRPWWCRWW